MYYLIENLLITLFAINSKIYTSFEMQFTFLFRQHKPGSSVVITFSTSVLKSKLKLFIKINVKLLAKHCLPVPTLGCYTKP